MTEQPIATSKSGLAPIRVLVALSALVIAVLLAGLGYHLWVSYQAAVADARRTTSNLARVLEAHTESTFQAVNVVLKSVAALTATKPRLHTLHTADTQAFLASYLANNPEIRDIVMLDAEGNMTHSAIFRGYPETVNFADRAYFSIHRERSDVGLYIEPPLIARVDERWFIPATRRLSWRDGSFAGVVFAVVEPRCFQAVYQAIEVGPNGRVALLMDDGRLMVDRSYPPPAEDAAAPPRAEPLAGTVETAAPDGVVRITSYLPIDGLPLVMAVSIAKDHALAEWRQHLWEMGLAAVLTIAAILGLCFFLASQIRRREAIHRQLLESERKVHAILAGLRHQTEQLAEMDHHRNRFLATLGHELRNPLAAIRSSVDALKGRQGAAEQRLQRPIGLIDQQLEQLTRIVDDLLDIARITHGKIGLRKQPVELAPILSRAVATIQPLIDARRHSLSVALPTEPIWLNADPIRLGQIVANLLDNAAKYTPEGGRIWLTARSEGDGVAIEVGDTGVGIVAEMLPRLFEPFVQHERPPELAESGLGLGLNLVRCLAELHGGRVEAHSAGPGQGSTFVVHLPARAEAPPAAEDRQEPPAARARRCILIVDDDAAVADSLALLLETMGQDIHTVYDGEAALATARRLQPDVVFIDLALPRLSGYEVARKLRTEIEEKPPQLIALTGYGQEDVIARAREAGFDRCLLKPFARRELAALLAPRPPS